MSRIYLVGILAVMALEKSTGRPQLPEDWQRTVIFLQKRVNFGQFLFLRGGLSETCTNYPYGGVCNVPIRHRIPGDNAYYNAWKIGDESLDWYGPESNQGTINGRNAEGTPMVWTTNTWGHRAFVSVEGYGYTDLNTFGEHYWMLDVDMDCSRTESGWVELKGFLPESDFNSGWEPDIDQEGTCLGNPGGKTPRDSRNHLARCGYLNVFSFGQNRCLIESLE